VDIMDEAFVYAEPAELARLLRDADAPRRWWPRLRPVVVQDRGDEGVRWSLSGELVGSGEVWLQREREGVRVHFFVRAEPTRRGDDGSRPRPAGWLATRRAARLTRRYQVGFKRAVWAVKDELEAGRPVGAPPPG
jgi:hypothetical protein